MALKKALHHRSSSRLDQRLRHRQGPSYEEEPTYQPDGARAQSLPFLALAGLQSLCLAVELPPNLNAPSQGLASRLCRTSELGKNLEPQPGKHGRIRPVMSIPEYVKTSKSLRGVPNSKTIQVQESTPRHDGGLYILSFTTFIFYFATSLAVLLQDSSSQSKTANDVIEIA
jgi:hypothetical protein